MEFKDVFLISGVVILLGYLFIGGSYFGFPKYEMPAIALLYIFLVTTLSAMNSHNNLKLAGNLALVFCLIQFFFIGDLLYVFRYELRQSIVSGLIPAQEIFQNILLKMGIGAGVFAALFFLFSKLFLSNPFKVFLLSASLGTNVGLCLLQSIAPYHTGYLYGGTGVIEAAQFVQSKIPRGSFVLAPSEIMYYINSENPRYMDYNLWFDSERLQKNLSNPNTFALVYSIVTNTTDTVKEINSNIAIQEVLNRQFNYFKIGSFNIWIRKT